MKDRDKIALAVTPLLAPIVLVVFSIFNGSSTWNTFGFLVSLVFSYIGMLVIGLPVILWLNNKDKLSQIHLILAGGVVGVVVWNTFLFFLGFILANTAQFSFVTLFGGALIGAAHGLVFSLLSGRS